MTRDPKIQVYYDEIVRCLMQYGNIPQDEAQRLVEHSRILEYDNERGRTLIFHEVPYYYAMELLYGHTNPQWYKDPALWPPPDAEM